MIKSKLNMLLIIIKIYIMYRQVSPEKTQHTKFHIKRSLSRELQTASSRGRYGERRQRDPCLKHTYKNTTCWPATAYDVTTGATTV